MRAYSSDTFVLPLPTGHRFPMAKYRRLRERVEAELPRIRLETPFAIDEPSILAVHAAGYWSKVRDGGLDRREQREMGFPWSPEMVERSRRSVGATLAACRAALDDGRSVNLAGGTHHAFADAGRGFCVLNDTAVAARVLQDGGEVRRLLIVDCDVHQGDGTAAIFQNDDSVYTLSLHGARNYPFRKQVSDLDVALADDTGDDEYLDALDRALSRALERARADLAVYLAGADPYEGDKLGRLALTRAGLAERDRRVLSALERAGLPTAVTMAGGYAEDVEDTVAIHLETVRLAGGG